MKLTRGQLRRAVQAWISNEVDPPGPAWLQWALTGAFAVLLALVFTALGMLLGSGGRRSVLGNLDMWVRVFGVNLFFCALISYLIHIAFAIVLPLLGRERIRRMSHGQRALLFTGVPIAGVLIGWPLAYSIISGALPEAWLRRDNWWGPAALATVVSFVLFVLFDAKARQALAEQHAAEARLKLLQSQIEPHFLFNTLAHVQSLLDVDTARARAMLESFTDFLRSSLHSLRRDDSSLQRELALAEAYLQLQHLRMEDRLRFSISVEQAARDAGMPPLLLQPLVENAIRHGLEPKVEGGAVRIGARRAGSELVVTIVDDGVGLDTHGPARTAGEGLALDNIRQRLATLYGDRAHLELQALNPGTQATLRLPYERIAGSADEATALAARA